MCVCTYGAVEDHEAVVEVVVLHGGVAVELGQWVVAPGHTQTVKTSCNPRIRAYNYIFSDDSRSSALPLYVGVVDSSVVQVVAEGGDHQSQDLHVAQVVLSGGG